MNRREAVTRVAWILGGTFSAPTLQAMSRWEELATKGKLQPQAGSFLTETQQAIVARVTELIIPKTDTPGALDAGVPDFMEVMLRDCYKKPAQDTFLAGVVDLERKGFLNLPPDQQTTTLKQIETEAQKSTSPTFWLITKELTLLGYFTSEVGVKASFDYQPIPGRFEAIKIKPGQKDFMYGNQA
ncbi:gluconate 2-dehydrogenase subunit 3 family protein [Spirosoma validum]|uniref:Gluconate 2-dehydrogenase subunit 3 family protein n=1 Tax=Spirosoma validum TaxID=2771355 RepID=A0A927B8Q1_9BACT|nr:gluconate 2-dehydrogenase subunit 3 family protein [Spirosoma validum]MBD2757197.1 gluconate 2-dehydrogenase subunit 3 family protein [Spirosoma validum]